MQKFIIELFTNRFGHVLAIGNLALIALSASGLTHWLGLDVWIKLSFLVNIPARIVSLIAFGNHLLPEGPFAPYSSQYAFGTLLLVYLQWIFVGWLTQTIARLLSNQVEFRRP